MPKLFVIIPRDHLRVAVQKVIRGTVGIAQVRFIDIHRDILIIMKYFHSIISNGLWRFTKVCLGLWPDCIEKFRIFEGIFCRCPHFKNQGKTTTLRAVFPTLCDKCINYSTSPISQYRRDEGEVAYGFFVLIQED